MPYRLDAAILPPHVATSYRVALVEATAERMIFVSDQPEESMPDDLKFVLEFRGTIVVESVAAENPEFIAYLSACEGMLASGEHRQMEPGKSTDDLFQSWCEENPKPLHETVDYCLQEQRQAAEIGQPPFPLAFLRSWREECARPEFIWGSILDNPRLADPPLPDFLQAMIWRRIWRFGFGERESYRYSAMLYHDFHGRGFHLRKVTLDLATVNVEELPSATNAPLTEDRPIPASQVIEVMKHLTAITVPAIQQHRYGFCSAHGGQRIGWAWENVSVELGLGNNPPDSWNATLKSAVQLLRAIDM